MEAKARCFLSWWLRAAVFVISGAIATSALGQSAASVSGTVTDQSGAVIPEATVTIRNTETNVVVSTLTNSLGLYVVPSIQPGNYEISASKSGFSTAREMGIRVTVGQAAIFNFTLKPGDVQQTVTVTSESSGVQTASSALGTVIGSKTILNLPLSGRNFTQLLNLTPGVSGIDVAQKGVFHGIGTVVLPAVNGQRNRSNMYYLDGSNDLGAFNGTYNYEPIVDDIQEFRILSHSDLAEYGGATGGVVSVVTRSGTNQYRGTLWEFIRNSALGNAKTYFSGQLNPLRWNQFGAVVGGPVSIPKLYNGHDRTFFTFSYEGYRDSQNAQSYQTTPTTAQLAGDFSSLCQTFNSSGICTKGTQLYDPYTTTPDPNKPGSFMRTPFAYNNVANKLGPASFLYAKTIFPAPNLSSPLSGGQNVLNSTPTRNDDDNYTGRIDQSFGNHDLLYGRISYYNQPYTSSAPNPGEVNSNLEEGWNISVHDVHTFGPRSIAEVFFGRNIGTLYSVVAHPAVPADFSNSLISSGFSSNFISGFSGVQSAVIPQIQVTGYLGDTNYTVNASNLSDTYEFGGSYTRIVGRHTIKVGASFSTDNFQKTQAQEGEVTDVPQTSNLESPANTGDALASFMVGVPLSSIRVGSHIIEKQSFVDTGYVQDQIQLRPNLTMNVGARYDVAKWPILQSSSSSGGYAGNLNLTTGNYEIDAVPPPCSSTQGAPCIPGGTLPAHVIRAPYGSRALHSTDFSNWSWRFGIAYHLWAKTSLLAGYGRYYDEWSSVIQLVQQYGGQWPAVESIQLNVENSTYPTNPLTDPLLQGSNQVTTPATPFTIAGYNSDPQMKQPYSDQWNFGIQQGFGANTVLTMSYVGAEARKLTMGIIGNTATTPGPGAITARQPFPYAVSSKYFNDLGSSNYQALQASLNHATGSGLTYLLAYTWSKSIDNGCSGSFLSEACDIQNPWNLTSARGVSAYDLPNILAFSVVYEFPFGEGRSFQSQSRAVNEIVGGWQMGLNTGYTSGDPLTPHVSGDIANIGGSFVLPNEVSNPIPAHQTAAQWFIASALQTPAQYTFGNYPRNSIRGPHHLGVVDLSAFKTFRIYRENSLEFRADAFDAFNHPVLGDPNITPGNKAYGTITSTSGGPRTMQLALKLHF